MPANVQMHLRGEGTEGTAPGTIPTGAKLTATGPKPFFRWSDNPMTRINLALKQALSSGRLIAMLRVQFTRPLFFAGMRGNGTHI